MRDIYHAFGIQVARRRQALGLTQPQLATQAWVAKSHVYNIERGTGNPTLNVVDRLARALQCSPADLLSPVQDQENPAHAQEVQDG